MADYLSEFETLANRIIGLPPPFLLVCFVSGLAPDIQREVQAHQPLTLVQAASLASLQEEKLSATRMTARPSPPPLSSIPPRSTMLPPLLPSPARPPPAPVRRLSLEEISSRRECGLCFTCDEKYHRGHRCASRVLLMVAEEEDLSWSNIDPGDPALNTDPLDSPNPLQAQISLNSLSGHLAPKALRWLALISNHCVTILVDGASIHNFVQPQVVTSLSLPCRRISTPLRVMVGNGQYLECASVCEDVLVYIQNHTFKIDLYILPISGANVILEVQWLKTLGPVLTNYNTISMQFFHQDQFVELKGDHTSNTCPLT